MNPLFATDDEDDKKPKRDPGYLLPNRHGRKIQPLHDTIRSGTSTGTPAVSAHYTTHNANQGSNPAVELIRRKLESLYVEEPDAGEELKEVVVQPRPQRSKHQQFMYDLSTSGKSLAQIQTEWHNYYAHLPDIEKHQVWQEFYVTNNRHPTAFMQQTQMPQPVATPTIAHPAHHIANNPSLRPTAVIAQTPTMPTNPMLVVGDYAQQTPPVKKSTPRTPQAAKKAVHTIKKRVVSKVNMSAAAQARAAQHVKSALFGLGTGSLVLIVVLFSFFNEVVVAPFIQPSSHASATPIILSANDVAPTPDPEVIIPKINVEIPVDYSLTSNDENGIENALEGGVVHYPSTVRPGEQGNAAFFGHSSNNIFNPGKYKFAFVLLHKLVPGDIFYLTYGNKVFTYRVYNKQIVDPSNVSVLSNVPDKLATATLITCDPPGTSLHRLVVWGEQISPDPSGASAPTPVTTTAPAQINGNGPTLWKRLTGWLFNT